MLALILAAFFYSPTRTADVKPVTLTDDMRADWLKYAATAEVCVADRMPAQHILKSWKKLGVKVLKRVAYDPECSVEYFRRKAGFLAIHEEADGVWLDGEDKFPATWKQALEEARIDAAVTTYCKSLAEQAMTWREKDNKVWIEGRRLLWFLRFIDFDSENLDTLRLEFVCYAKRLEQLLGLPAKKLPLAVAKPIEPDRAPFVPFAGRDVGRAQVSLDGKEPVKLSEGLSFSADTRGFCFTIASKEKYSGAWPGGKGSFTMYLADGNGGFLPYEFQLDLSPVPGNRAPTDAYGLWFLEERWDKGALQLYGAEKNWRLVAVPRGSYSSKYPKLYPRLDFKAGKDGGGWTVSLRFSWLSVWGLWPSVRNGAMDKWYASVDAFPGVPAGACRLDWPRGREVNFKRIATNISCDEITGRYAGQKAQAGGIYHLWYEERLYGFAKTKEPTFQRCDPESDKVFWERVVEPMLADNQNLEDITRVSKDRDNNRIAPKLEKANDAVKMSVYKSLGKLFTLAERVGAARRDYILQRYAGGMPPEPPKKAKPEGAAAVTAPDADNDDDAIQLDDKEF